VYRLRSRFLENRVPSLSRCEWRYHSRKWCSGQEIAPIIADLFGIFAARCRKMGIWRQNERRFAKNLRENAVSAAIFVVLAFE
jgi:hypothetical protein